MYFLWYGTVLSKRSLTSAFTSELWIWELAQVWKLVEGSRFFLLAADISLLPTCSQSFLIKTRKPLIAYPPISLLCHRSPWVRTGWSPLRLCCPLHNHIHLHFDSEALNLICYSRILSCSLIVGTVSWQGLLLLQRITTELLGMQGPFHQQISHCIGEGWPQDPHMWHSQLTGSQISILNPSQHWPRLRTFWPFSKAVLTSFLIYFRPSGVCMRVFSRLTRP